MLKLMLSLGPSILSLAGGLLLLLYGVWRLKRALTAGARSKSKVYMGIIETVVCLVLAAGATFAGVAALPNSLVSIRWKRKWLHTLLGSASVRHIVIHGTPILILGGGLFFVLLGLAGAKRALTPGHKMKSTVRMGIGESIAWSLVGLGVIFEGIVELPHSPVHTTHAERLLLGGVALVAVVVMLAMTSRQDSRGS